MSSNNERQKKRKARIRNSPHFKNGAFQNLSPTPTMPDGGFFKVLGQFLNKPVGVKPVHALPNVKTDLKNLDEGSLVWFGHSSYILKAEGKIILVDPVFSGHASPFSFMVKSFKGADLYKAEYLPVIDLLVLTHDHYDHLDRKLLGKIRQKVGCVVCSLGVGTHLDNWGWDDKEIIELDWWEDVTVEGLSLRAVPARHFSGRGLKRGGSIWSGFVLKSGAFNLFLGGDSGYDTHFKKVGEEYGPFDLALLECGQYNTMWPLIHMMPEETVQAALDLKAKALMPVHWGKFSLAMHPWQEPAERVIAEAERRKLTVVTPMIGEPVKLRQLQKFSPWWKSAG
jgi:L-ascorbate metabolism protein UlaG (beta-lactamase superfamily)